MSGTINIHGKQYRTVAYRVSLFRAQCPPAEGWGLVTAIEEDDGKRVVVRAMVVAPSGKVVATGHAEELRGSSKINKTSAMENAETGAIGRALAAFGLGGENYASADEVENKRKAAHTWTPNERSRFMASINASGWKYEELCKHPKVAPYGRPSTWPRDKREGLLRAIEEGRLVPGTPPPESSG